MLIVALLAAAGSAALVTPPPRQPPPASSADRAARSRSRWWTTPWPAAGLAGAAVLQIVGGGSGLLLGAAVAIGVWRWIASAEPAASRRRRAELERDLPLTLDLLVACVSAGRSPSAALDAVADAVPGPLADRLRSASTRLAFGADPDVVWRDLATDPVLAPLGNALGRSARTGASVTTALTRCADDARRRRRARAETVARSVGVRAAAPLGACFLPAFLLIGVVPTIVGAFGALSR